MFSLNFVSKNPELKNNTILDIKTNSKKSSNDFSQILEGQRDSIKKRNKGLSIQDGEIENKIPKTIEEEQPKTIEEKLEEIEELKTYEEEMKVIDVLQNLFILYALLESLDMDCKELKETVFELIEIEVGETLNLLEKMFNGEIIINEEFSLDVTDNIEQFIELLEKEIGEYKGVYDAEIKLPIEESLIQLEKGVENLKGFLAKDPKILVENKVEIEKNLVENPNMVENLPIEAEDSKGKNLSNKEGDPEPDFLREENIEIEENQIPNFEIKTQILQKEPNPLEIEKPQNIETPKIVEQIVDKAKIIVDDFKQEVRISLKPEILGEVVLKMEAVKGSITTKIMVDNHRTKDLIEANLYQLKEEMKENGLEIKTFEVFVGSNEDFQRERTQEFLLNKKPKKVKIKDEEINEIKKYDTNVLQELDNTYNIYGESKLNLFA